MSYYHDFQETIQLIRAMDRIATHAKSIPNLKDRAEFLVAVIDNTLNTTYHSDGAKLEIYRELQAWINPRASRVND